MTAWVWAPPLGVLLIWGIYDVVLLWRSHWDVTETISYKIQVWGKLNPIVPFIAGLIIGGLACHFWWPVVDCN